jgi:hypothetical protein
LLLQWHMTTTADSVAIISGLQADLVPHREWAISRWLYANPIWYYHRQSASHELRFDGRFYQLVDPMLRAACRLLNDAGLRTTPSCEGHSYSKARFEQIWSELKREEPAIRGSGLLVKDCENEQPYLFRDSDYHLPWTSFDTFYKEAATHQSLGYLGILAPQSTLPLAQHLQEELSNRGTDGVRIESEWSEILGGLLIAVHVNVEEPNRRATTWQQFTEHVRQLVCP